MYIFIIYINNTSLLQLYMMDQVESFREEQKKSRLKMKLFHLDVIKSNKYLPSLLNKSVSHKDKFNQC